MTFLPQQEEQAFTIPSKLEAMCQQETTTYQCHDYLQCHNDDMMTSLSQDDIEICINNRSKMVQWCLTLMDACQLDRDVVSIGMNYMDRFLSTQHGKECIEDAATFQLACMTCLYTAIKIHGEKAISPQTLSQISRGFYTQKDMEAMEWTILQALQWRVNVPTPVSFVREILALIPQTAINEDQKDQLLSVCKTQIEMTVAEYLFVTFQPSSVAIASLVNAMDVMGIPTQLLQQYAKVEQWMNTTQVVELQRALRTAMASSFPHMAHVVSSSPVYKTKTATSPRPKRTSLSSAHSPRCVANSAA